MQNVGMEPMWRTQLRRLMKERNINAKQLGKAIGRNERLIYDWLVKTDAPRIDLLERAADALGVTLPELVSGEPHERQLVPVAGIVTAGDGWSVYDDGGHDPIPLAVSGGEAVAVEVRGDSMLNYYKNGDILIGIKKLGRSLTELIGRDCIIETSDGKRLLKFVQKGSMKDRFNLRSHNIEHPDIQNAELKWAAPVEWIKRR